MIDIGKLDDELYKAIYGLLKVGNYNEVWSRIKSDPKILREAVKITRDKFDEKDLVKGLTIADAMLRDYEGVDDIAYNSLISSIYTNPDIARIVMKGAMNGGFSYLLMSLWNHNLKLTEEQKTFAVNEAMNKVGTTRSMQSRKYFSKKLNDLGISDDNTVFIDVDGCKNPVGQKTVLECVNYMFFSLSNQQAHGNGAFDIRYHILRNPNWSLEEKQKLIMDFWYDDQDYDECLEQWEWAIVNDSQNDKDNSLFYDKSELYNCSYDMLLDFYGDKKIANRIWQEIQFCKQMHKLRPQQWEVQYASKKKVLG